MTRQVVSLGAGNLGHPGQLDPWDGAVRLDPALVAGGGEAWLRHVSRSSGGGARIRLAASADGDPPASGPEFTDAVKRHAAAFVFTQGAYSVTLKGPAHSDIGWADPTERYFWHPDNLEAWVAWVTRLGGIAGEVELVIDDGAPRAFVLADLAIPVERAFEMAALLVASGSAVLYADSDRGGSDTPLEGELGIGPGETRISSIRYDGSSLRFNDNDRPAALALEAYFRPFGPGADLWFHLQTDDGIAHASVAALYEGDDRAGGGYVNFTPPAAMRTLLDGIEAGDRFIVALTRAKARPAGLDIGLHPASPVALDKARPAVLDIALEPGRPAFAVRARPLALPIALAPGRPALAHRARPLALPLALAPGRPVVRIPLTAAFRIPARMALAHRAAPAPHAAGARWRRTVRALVPERGLLAACVIEHPLAPEPLRIVSAPRGRALGGIAYLGVPFTWRLAPDEADRGPRTQIAIPWTGPEMAELLEASGGGVGASIELSEWSLDPLDPEAPAEPEWRLRFHVTAAAVTPLKDAPELAGERPRALVLDLGVTPRADRPAVAARYTPESDPWLFA